MARDALDSSAPQLQQAVALHALSALVAVSAASASSPTALPAIPGSVPYAVTRASGGGALVTTLYAHNVPQALLAGLAGVPQVRSVSFSLFLVCVCCTPSCDACKWWCASVYTVCTHTHNVPQALLAGLAGVPQVC